MNRLLLFLFFIFLFILPSTIEAQNMKSVLKLFQKNKFQRAKSSLDFLFLKDSSHAGYLYLISLYYTHPNSGETNLDLAYRRINKSIRVYERSTTRGRVKAMRKAGILDSTLHNQKQNIENQAMRLADSLGTEEAYQHFIVFYRTAPHLKEAFDKRNAVAYDKARSINTYQSYKAFLDQYPTAQQASEALKAYETLLLEAKTKDGTLASYETFLLQYPQSALRAEAEDKLYYSYINDHHVAVYESFVKKYPQTAITKKAWAWLWLLSGDKKRFFELHPECAIKPDLLDFEHYQHRRLFPFYEEGKIGLADDKGNTIIPPIFEGLSPEFLCATQTIDVIVAYANKKAALFSKSGTKLTGFDYDDILYLDSAVMKIKQNNKFGLLQKFGHQITPCIYDQIEPLNEYFVTKKNNKFGLLLPNGKELLREEYDKIAALQNDTVMLWKGDVFYIASKYDLIQGFPNKIAFATAAYKISHLHFLLHEDKGKKGILTLTGNYIVECKADEIYEIPTGWAIREGKNRYFLETSGKRFALQTAAEAWQVYDNFCAVRLAKFWGFYSFTTEEILPPVFDNFKMMNPKELMLWRNNKVFIFANNTLTTALSKEYEWQTVYLNETSTAGEALRHLFLVAQDKRGNKGLFTDKGKEILPVRYNRIDILPTGILTENENLFGLFDYSGKNILSVKYNGILPQADGWFALFRNEKFGIFNPKKDILIEPSQEAQVRVYSDTLDLLVTKREKFGLIDKRNRKITPHIFDDIRYWTDSVMLVKVADLWRLYDFRKNYYLPETFYDFRYEKETPHEILIQTYRTSGYGLLSNTRGRIIPEDYSDIVNVGTIQKPFYRVDKYIAQARLHVVLYIDENGKVVRDFVAREDAFEKVICNEK